MSRNIAYILILLVPLVPVWVLYKYLKQGLHEATFANKLWRFTGPAALYLVLVGLGFRYLLPLPLPPKFPVTAQLWPRQDISADFLKAKEARLYVTYGSTEEPFTDFVGTPDFLEQTKDVDASLKDRPVQLTLTPKAKYRAEPNVLYLSGLLRVNVVPAGAQSAPVSVNTTIDGKPFHATTWVPIPKNVSQVSATLDKNHPSIEWASGKASLISLGGREFSLEDKLEIVDSSGALVKDAWVGNELGAVNGRPIAVSTDGKVLKAYGSLPKGAAGNYLLRVTEPGGRQYSIPTVAVSEQGRGSGLSEEWKPNAFPESESRMQTKGSATKPSDKAATESPKKKGNPVVQNILSESESTLKTQGSTVKPSGEPLPALTQSNCGSPIKLINRHPLTLADPRFNDAVYLYVDEIKDDWTKRRPNLTVLYGYSPTWSKDRNGQYVFVKPGVFESQTKQVPRENKWSLKIQHEGDAIQFRYGTSYYLLGVMKVATGQKPFNYLELQVCERPPLSPR